MKKIMNKDNKGFSLIELIIVIAIMAVLVAVIAPNLTKYLGSSKKQTDAKNLDEITQQVKNCIADAATQEISVTAGDITLDGSAASIASGSTGIETLLNKTLKDAKTVSKVTPSNKKVKVTLTGDETEGFEVSAVFTN